jgi:hypothetical protein
MTSREQTIDVMVREYEEQARPALRERISITLALRDIDRITHRTKASIIEEHLRDNDASTSLDDLVALGCDRAIIITALSRMIDGERPSRWLGLASRHELETAINKIRKAQETTEQLHPSINAFRHLTDQWEWLATFPLLPAILNSYAAFLQFHAESEESPRSVEKELLIAHVWSQTGSPHDKQVATLIASMPGNAGYTTEAHAKWRSRNQNDIESTMRMLQMDV